MAKETKSQKEARLKKEKAAKEAAEQKKKTRWRRQNGRHGKAKVRP